MTPLSIVGLCGSLRRESLNMAALRAAERRMPQGMTLHIRSLEGLSIYSADEQERGWPEAVSLLSKAIAQADAVLIASPEYNFSVPGGLKNAIDWLSRLSPQPFRDKPVAIMGAATGPLGTARMQYDLRRILQGLEARLLLKPEVFISNAKSKFDESGNLIDELTGKFIQDQMQAFGRWIMRERAASALA